MAAWNIAIFLLMFQLMKTMQFTVAPQKGSSVLLRYMFPSANFDSPNDTAVIVMEACHISLLMSKNKPCLWRKLLLQG